jgi:hypothetical protein
MGHQTSEQNDYALVAGRWPRPVADVISVTRVAIGATDGARTPRRKKRPAILASNQRPATLEQDVTEPPRRTLVRALVRFYVRGSARTAQRNALLAISVVIIVVGSLPTLPLTMIREIALSLGARGVSPSALLVMTLLCAGLASAAAPTLTLGLGGWMRSLPLSGTQHRRAITLALLAPLWPMLAMEAIAIALVPIAYGLPVAPAKLAAIPLAAIAAAASGVPSQRGLLARSIAISAAMVATYGRWSTWLAAVVLLAIADAIAGPIALGPRPSVRRTGRAAGIGDSSGIARRVWVRLAWRAIGWRAAPPIVAGVLLVGWAHFYRVNNGLSVATGRTSMLLCSCFAVVIMFAILADLLVVRRPQWPWARSLAWGSRRRIVDDAIAIAAFALPIVVATAREDWLSALVLLASLPLLAVISAGAIRRARGRVSRAGAEVLVTCGVAAALVSVWPILVFGCLAVVPFAVERAARADRRLIVTGWSELHHSAGGDSLIGGAR